MDATQSHSQPKLMTAHIQACSLGSSPSFACAVAVQIYSGNHLLPPRSPKTQANTLKCPVAMGKKGIVFWLVEFKRETFQTKEIRAPLGNRVQALAEGSKDTVRSSSSSCEWRQTALQHRNPTSKSTYCKVSSPASAGNFVTGTKLHSCRMWDGSGKL